MRRSGSGRLLVTDGGRLVGIITLKDLLRFLSLKIELEGLDRGRPGPAPAGPPTDGRRPAETLVAAHR